MDDGVLWRRWANSDFFLLNWVFVPPFAADRTQVRRSLEAARDYLQRHTKPGMIAVARERLNQADPDNVRFIGVQEQAAMVEMQGNVCKMSLPSTAGLRFERVTTNAMLDAYADVNAKAYGVPLAAGRDGVAMKSGEAMLAAYSFLAFKGDHVTAVASVMPHDGRLYLGFVATLPDVQRQGFASAVIAHALREAKAATGLDRSNLHATLAGATVYARLGYRAVSEFAPLQLAPAL